MIEAVGSHKKEVNLKMMRSLYSGVSGLRSHQTRMDVVGNNIANVNTIGFKKGRVTFKDMISQMMQAPTQGGASRGGTNARQIGMGVEIGTIDQNFAQGNLQYTGMLSDLAVNGSGFFIVNDGARNFYTRAGNFDLDAGSNLVHGANGFRLQGWTVGADGNINSSRPVTNLNIPMGDRMSPSTTSFIRYDGNLDSSAVSYKEVFADVLKLAALKENVTIEFSNTPATPPALLDVAFTSDSVTGHTITINGIVDGTTTAADIEAAIQAEILASPQLAELISVEVLDPTPAGTLAAGNFVLPDPQNLTQYESTISVYDSFGSRHEVVLKFEKNASNGVNQWQWTVEGDSVVGGPSTTGTVVFSDRGLVIGGGGTTIQIAPTDGAQNPFDVQLDFSALTQYTGDFSAEARELDGNEMGFLQSFNIDERGVINGLYTNGRSRTLGMIALANFANEGGLIKTGESFFAESVNSGNPSIGSAGRGGRGDIQSATLEMSNVDMAEEFADMIITQRGYQANSTVITTADQMLQELLNIKR